MKSAIANLFGVGQDARHGRTQREIEVEQMPEQLRIGLAAEHRCDSFDELAARLGAIVAVEDLEAPGEKIAQQPIGLGNLLEIGARFEPPCGARLEVNPTLHFGQQARLAEPRVAHHGDGGKQPVLDHAVERILEPLQFRIAAHHARLDALDAPYRDAQRTRPGTRDEIGTHRHIAALDRDGRLLAGVEDSPNVPVGRMRDAQTAARRTLFHAPCEIDGHTHGAVIGFHASAEKHLTGVDADTNRKFSHAIVAVYILRIRRRIVEQREARAHRAFGIVLARDIGAERSRQAVAHETQHASAVRFDDGAESGQRTVHQGQRVFGVEQLTHARRVRYIGEQYGDLLELLGGAARALAGRGKRRTQGRKSGIDDCVAEERALRFQRADCLFDLIPFRHRESIESRG